MNLFFYKYQGTGNDFIIIDNRNDDINLNKKQVTQLCDRRFGVGADGLMLIKNKPGFDFEMIYYNADGNMSTMCGNGGRCLVKFAYNMGLRKSDYLFNAVDGPHNANIESNGWVDLKMKDVDSVETSMLSDYILDTGSPHYVKPAGDVQHIDVVKQARDIRYGKRFADKGINVNFVELEEEGKIYVRTYERGVEDETLSCGTGVTASALVFAHNENGFNHVVVKTPGGNLAVDFDKTGETSFKNIWLCGPAVFVFKGEIELL